MSNKHLKAFLKLKWTQNSKTNYKVWPSNLEAWWTQMQGLTTNKYLVNQEILTCKYQMVEMPNNSKTFLKRRRTWAWCNSKWRSRCSNSRTALEATLALRISSLDRRVLLRSSNSSSNCKWIQWWCSSRCLCNNKCRCPQCINLFKMELKNSYPWSNLITLNKPTCRSTTPSKRYRTTPKLASNFSTNSNPKTSYTTWSKKDKIPESAVAFHLKWCSISSNSLKNEEIEK